MYFRFVSTTSHQYWYTHFFDVGMVWIQILCDVDASPAQSKPSCNALDCPWRRTQLTSLEWVPCWRPVSSLTPCIAEIPSAVGAAGPPAHETFSSAWRLSSAQLEPFLYHTGPLLPSIGALCRDCAEGAVDLQKYGEGKMVIDCKTKIHDETLYMHIVLCLSNISYILWVVHFQHSYFSISFPCIHVHVHVCIKGIKYLHVHLHSTVFPILFKP